MNEPVTTAKGTYVWLPAALILVMLAGVVTDLLNAAHEGSAGVFSLPGFWSVFGLVGCLMLAGVCKLVARLFLKRPENYYDDVL
jgi:membrane protein implicated in regulation of membrane protease activity